MRIQDIVIGGLYRHRDMPSNGFVKTISVLKPQKGDFWKTEEEKKIKHTVVKCEWIINGIFPFNIKDGYMYKIMYFRPSDLRQLI